MINSGDESDVDNHISMSNISKSFLNTRVLNKIDFSCSAGEVHALVGLNGAGKSTLMKILGGVLQADEGVVLLNGQQVAITSPASATANGISMIHQEYSLINELTVAGNIFLGREIKLKGTPFLNKHAMAKRVKLELDRFDLSLNPNESVRELNSGEKQIVEIIRALLSDSWLIVMDEPTSALSEEDKEKLFEFIRRMKTERISIIYISHHMPEIFSIADRVTVMRDGQIVLSEFTSETDESSVIAAMTGEELQNFVKPHKEITNDILLSISQISKAGAYKDLSLNVRRGEIVVLTGLRGCGAAELTKSVFGLDANYEGEIFFYDRLLTPGRGPAASVKEGMGLVTENRDKNGILAPLSVRDNIALPFLEKCLSAGIIHNKKINERVLSAADATSTKMSSTNQEVRFLSGGNKQKICFSRWLDPDLQLLLLLEPTRGIDVHAKADIYRIIEDMARNGVGVLIVSYEIDEVMLLGDRAFTLYDGRCIAEYSHSEFDKQQMLADISGASVHSLSGVG